MNKIISLDRISQSLELSSETCFKMAVWGSNWRSTAFRRCQLGQFWGVILLLNPRDLFFGFLDLKFSLISRVPPYSYLNFPRKSIVSSNFSNVFFFYFCNYSVFTNGKITTNRISVYQTCG